ncbi:MAG: PKD domain-containing protein, partial [Candidatus Limnocylindrales bacterium]
LYSAPAGATTALVIDLTGVYTTGSGATFTPLGPTRILDTRVGSGGTSGALRAGVPQTVHLAGTDGVPGDATAVTLNATIVGQTAAGYLSITPEPTSAPETSILNFPLGDIRANGITLPLSSLGSVSIVYMAAPGARANVVLDLSGFFR